MAKKAKKKKESQVEIIDASDEALKVADDFVKSVGTPEKLADFFNSFCELPQKKGVTKSIRDKVNDPRMTIEAAIHLNHAWYWEWKYPHVALDVRNYFKLAAELENIRKNGFELIEVSVAKKDGSRFEACDFKFELNPSNTLAAQTAANKSTAKTTAKTTAKKSTKKAAK